MLTPNKYNFLKLNNERNTMKNGKLAGKVAIVTGASKGIGADIARHLAAEGASVVVNYSSSKEGADRVVDEITRNGGNAVAIQADVANESDILVNNAGVYEFIPLEQVTPDKFHRMFDLNVLGLILASKEAVKHFGPEGG